MKKLPVVLLILLTVKNLCHGQLPVPADSLYTFIKYNSVHRRAADWKQIDSSFQKKIGQARSLSDTMKSFVYVLAQLNDVHCQIYLNNQFFGHYPVFDDSVIAWLKPLNDKAVSLTNKIYTESINGNIAYIRVPSIQAYEQVQINRFAQALYDSAYQLAKKKPEAFIVDLRLNGGGNVYPMLSGLSPLLGNTIVAYETDSRDSIVRTWEIQNNNFVTGGYTATQIVAKKTGNLENKPVVVLTGPVTKSSGSMTAIAFKQRPKAILIGEPTADGYTTSNGFFRFAPNLTINFATHFVADRALHIYKTNVSPAILVQGGDNFENLLQDKKMIAAISWLHANKKLR